MDERDGIDGVQRDASPEGGRAVATTAAGGEQVKQFIYNAQNGLQLGPVLELAQRTHKDWDDAKLRLAEKCYRDFLWVCWNYVQEGDAMAAISVLADEVWHCHMQMPAKYRDDCAEIFGAGSILDHRPVLNGKQVSPPDEAQAGAEYEKLHIPVPDDLVNRCIWAVVA